MSAPAPGAGWPAPRPRGRRPTATSGFGVSRRESHDATAFYSRFTPPVVSTDSTIGPRRAEDALFVGDARSMSGVGDNSVALVVTSPPYFAGKEYEEALGQGHVPVDYLDYLRMLEDVFAECVRTLEPGGRIAVNVANLGRRPYRSLATDVVSILQDRLRLLLRGEVVWWKQRGAGGSCAWGTFQRPANPVLRDLTERVVIASKGRFDRALSARERAGRRLPSVPTLSRDEFLEATTDVWEIAPESATRVGHPAPFPVELPLRLIGLYTYVDDLVLDPFMGSGTTAVAAMRAGRRYVGYDTSADYVARAEARIAAERARVGGAASGTTVEGGFAGRSAARTADAAAGPAGPLSRALREGRTAVEVAGLLLETCGFVDLRFARRTPAAGVVPTYRARDLVGNEWSFDVCGGFTTSRGGLRRSETLWRSLGRAAALHHARPDVPVVLLTTEGPAPSSAGAVALRSLEGAGRPVHAALELGDPRSETRLRAWAAGGPAAP